MAVIALITGLIIYSTVTRMLYSDLENTLIRYAEQRAATIEAYLSGCCRAGSISSNSIISNSGLPVEERLAELKSNLTRISTKVYITDANGISVSLMVRNQIFTIRNIMLKQ